MKLKRYIAFLTTAVLMLGTLCGCSGENNTSQNNEAQNAEVTQVKNTYILNDETVKLVGRTYLGEDNTLWCSLSGTGIEFNFTGKTLDLTLVGDGASEKSANEDNYARYAIYVDGERKIEDYLNEKERTVSVIDSETEVTAKVRFIKLSECAMSNIGIRPIECDGTLVPTEAKDLKIEFIGDSITCGYGTDDEDPNHHFKTITEDFTKAYAYKTAQILDADYSAFSISGWGIISGYTDNGTKKKDQRIPKFYEKTAFSYQMVEESTTPQSIPWDFSRYTPDLVVVNLGTNDDSYCEEDAERWDEYIEGYVNFLGTVHGKYPEAKLLLCIGTMRNRPYPYIEKVAEKFKAESGFNEVYTKLLTTQDGSLGIAADYHPTPATHDVTAKELSEEIKKIMNL